ncbi:uncharacterized protein C2orf42 homolog isoform X1 [Syngnathus typhle]|uniref:uncharacterized protein C2orf42 homolog isoform X1 n=1 Tax=Syngnathus typhle TaxID=161592 RepID=UPI002A6A0CFA|nr:uncharacterized protein C2orf42 homolog isoform X1 [Syngnathus typhle]XP_061149278.1 uncharacterized protein C2orf42 homolog isoform X1 [Syngnathus typhle]
MEGMAPSIIPPLSATPLAAKQQDVHTKAGSAVTPAFLSNLGRATLRGIRKCPRCGVYNGTRGLSCKNKLCGISLRNATSGNRGSRKGGVEAVRVIIDSEEREGKEQDNNEGGGVQVFSVCHRERGSAQLGFVGLSPTDTAISTGERHPMLSQINMGRCFMPACKQGSRSDRSESGLPDTLCVHIKTAIECRRSAAPLSVKSSALEALTASMQDKEELWGLATESPGPLVQRVSKDTLVVKCRPDSAHALGLLHLTVGGGVGPSNVAKGGRRTRRATQQQAAFHCACRPQTAEASCATDHPDPSHPCLHFYACVCAFASDEKLASEFATFISSATTGIVPTPTGKVLVPCERPPPLPTEPLRYLHKAKKPRPDEAPSAGTQMVDEGSMSLSFYQWLAGVTERIQQTMHYQFDGKPDPLVYYIPQQFFNALQHRLSLGSKRRLPNFTTVLENNDGVPQGSLSKYTWHITNLALVKRIFDTPELQLELTQSFVRNMDGSYSRFHCPQPPPEPAPADGIRTDRTLPIRPMELQTFLKVGPGSDDPEEPGPFVIEWTPDVLPRCHMGKLRILYQFGHQQSGQQAECGEKDGHSTTGRVKDSSQEGNLRAHTH